MKIKKGDKVQVLTGKNKGKDGIVLKVFPETKKILVEGINVVKKHQKATQTQAPGIVEKTLPIHVSNVSMLDPKDNKPTRIGYKVLNDGKKVRFAKRSGEVVA
ncbi:MAG: 50S ribosomal protein L24 [Alphaproteobacteria bacterium]|nr:MAG: 50S ribosomal protein L24 [Rickettsiaceae bacterium 4572_127]